MDYHRWHSPVKGRIAKTRMQPGTYFSQIEAEGLDPWTPNGSQAYLTAVATRAMIFIEADNPDIGLMCFMPVGITEVSSCAITVVPGQHVDKGDELGSFHYGGSTYCLIFRPQTKLVFRKTAHDLGQDATVIPVNSALAFAQPS